MSRVEERLRFEADGSITALSGKVEYGQGLRASFPRIVAEELGVPPSRVRLVLGETDVVPWDMGTFGSMSVEFEGKELRRCAAVARAVILARASARLACPVAELEVVDGGVRRKAGGPSTPIQELAKEGPITGEVPEDVAVLSPTPTCPDAPLGPYARDIVTGRAEFVADVRLPGMLHGRVLHAPVHGAQLRSIDHAAAVALPGVVAVVHEGTFAGVVAERHGQALAALRALEPIWDAPPAVRSDPTDVSLRNDPGVEAALAAGSQRFLQHYYTPHVASAPIGPSVGVADVRAEEATVYGTTQVPFRLREAVAHITGLAPERVHFHPRAMSGGYGRHGASDAAIEAARLSRAVGRPVMVQWGRADELCAAPNRPEMTAKLEAGLNTDGTIAGWRCEVWTNPYSYQGDEAPPEMLAMMCGRNAVPSYDLGPASVVLHVAPGEVRTGALRSLGASPNTFAIESFMDELARAAGMDPIAFRLRHVTDPRLRRVLETVRERSGWSTARREDGHGFGVACAVYRRTYVAEVVEVSVSKGSVRLERVWCAVDAGHIVHPDGARSQVEGAVQHAASWTLLEELPHRGREVTATSWDDYPIATFLDAPRSIDIIFTGDDSTPPSGMGEPPSVPIAPAVANAVFDACGERIRRLPIRPRKSC